MLDILYYLAIVVALAVVTIGGAFLVRSYASGAGPAQAIGGLFGPKPERRLSSREPFNIGGRRRLSLVRRDDVENLVISGGPVDVIIETGIGAPPAPAAGPASASSVSRG